MPGAHMKCCQAECSYADCHYAMCRNVECHNAKCHTECLMLSVSMLCLMLSGLWSVIYGKQINLAYKINYAKCQYAVCHTSYTVLLSAFYSVCVMLSVYNLCSDQMK